MKKMSFAEMEKLMQEYNRKGMDKVAYIVFSQKNFLTPYSEQARTYVVHSTEKFFNSDMNGMSLYGDALDGSDDSVDLNQYNWEVEFCYMK